MSKRDDFSRQLKERIVAMEIVNKAVDRCKLLGMPLNSENIILCVGDHFDPSDERFRGVIEEIFWAIDTKLSETSDPTALN